MSKSDSDYEQNLGKYRVAAKDFKSKVLFVVIDTDDDEHEKLMEFFALKREETPAMRLIKMDQAMTKYKPEKSDFTEEAIKEFVNGVLEGKIKV